MNPPIGETFIPEEDEVEEESYLYQSDSDINHFEDEMPLCPFLPY